MVSQWLILLRLITTQDWLQPVVAEMSFFLGKINNVGLSHTVNLTMARSMAK